MDPGVGRVISSKASCLACNTKYGENRVVRSVPAGWRIAFAPSQARLWIVCERCGTWNLVPMENRLDAIEECERLFSLVDMQHSTATIGLAELPSGLQLIRVGMTDPGEFAAWRYGRRFASRKKRVIARLSAGAAAILLALLGAGWLAAAGGSILLMYLGAVALAWVRSRTQRPVAHLSIPGVGRMSFRRFDLRFLRLLREHGKWGLDAQIGDRLITGPDALVGLAGILPVINRWGGSSGDRQEALRLLADAGGPEAYLAQLPHRPFEAIAQYHQAERLALEMAVNEAVERRVLEDELSALKLAWQIAEETGAIADALLTPAWVQNRIAAIRSKSEGTTTNANGL